MKYIFFGGKTIGNYVLNGLLKSNFKPNGIVCYKEIIDFELLKLAEQQGIQILKINKFRDEQELLKNFIIKAEVDGFVSVAFPFILSNEILELVDHPINIHTGAIPKYRGHHPLSAALLNDEPYQATTVHRMAEDVDAGEVLLQDFIEVNNEDDIVSIRERLTKLSLNLILTVLDQILNNCCYPKQQVGEVIWAPKRTPEDSKIDWSKPSRYIHNFVRALVDPYPNAFTFNSENILINIKKSMASDRPGKVLAEMPDNHYVIATGDGVVLVQVDKKLKVGEFLK